jgi:hypothetical protein
LARPGAEALTEFTLDLGPGEFSSLKNTLANPLAYDGYDLKDSTRHSVVMRVDGENILRPEWQWPFWFWRFGA